MAVKIAMLHYHARPGGVTTVIRHARRAHWMVSSVTPSVPANRVEMKPIFMTTDTLA